MVEEAMRMKTRGKEEKIQGTKKKETCPAPPPKKEVDQSKILLRGNMQTSGPMQVDTDGHRVRTITVHCCTT